MKFKNTSNRALGFDLRGIHYDVPPGAEVDIPDRVAYAVKRRRLPLEPIQGAEGEDEAKPQPVEDDAPPADPVARLWFDRAHNMRRELMVVYEEKASLGASLGEANATIETLRAQVEPAANFAASVRDRLGIGPQDSVLEAIDKLRSDLAAAQELLEQPPAAPPGELPAGSTAPPPEKPAVRRPK